MDLKESLPFYTYKSKKQSWENGALQFIAWAIFEPFIVL